MHELNWEGLRTTEGLLRTEEKRFWAVPIGSALT